MISLWFGEVQLKTNTSFLEISIPSTPQSSLPFLMSILKVHLVVAQYLTQFLFWTPHVASVKIRSSQIYSRKKLTGINICWLAVVILQVCVTIIHGHFWVQLFGTKNFCPLFTKIPKKFLVLLLFVYFILLRFIICDLFVTFVLLNLKYWVVQT